ncbi:MFS transporter [Streptomyces sp. TM32]|uniref:MFS transporter n=1 Tax=Streptomyces sp. TM32 TaxID=1652669 RepID=UPI0020B11DCA|nr:MFS transporter [Streptomyces sp. TM32]
MPQPSDAPAASGVDPGDIAAPPRRRPRAVRATLMGSVAALLLSAAIVLGSRMLRDFDSALLPYAVATVFLAFGIAYRCTVRCSDPSARRLHRQAGRPTLLSKDARSTEDATGAEISSAGPSPRSPRQGCSRQGGSSVGSRDEGRAEEDFRYLPEEGLRSLPEEGLRRVSAALPREAVAGLGFRKFVGAHSAARWVAHQLLFWGCLLAVLISIPLVWGWLTFTAATGPGPGPGPGYDLRIWGFRVIGFDPSDIIGWFVFRGLDLAALLVIAGAGYFLWRRLRDRAAVPGARVAYDLVPLLALLVISVTGLLLTFSALFLHGGGYRLLALLHMASVLFTLVYLPLGKFFHPVRRSGAVGEKPFARSARLDE